MGKQWKQWQTLFSWAPKIIADSSCSYEIKRHLLLRRKAMANIDSILKSRDITLLINVRLVKAIVFPVVMYGCESWTINKAERRRMMVLNCGAEEDSWESLGLQRDQTSQSWRKSTLNIHWKDRWWSWSSNNLATWLNGKDPDAGKDWRQKEKGTTEDEIVGWHHQLNGHELEQTPGDSEGQGRLVCCSPWGHKESGTNELLN